MIHWHRGDCAGLFPASAYMFAYIEGFSGSMLAWTFAALAAAMDRKQPMQRWMASATARLMKSAEVVWRVQFRINGQMRQESFSDARAAIDFGSLVDRVGDKAARESRDLRSQANVSRLPLTQGTAD